MRPPDKFDMVDMEGIDLLAVQGEEIPGLYNKLVESITLCRYQCLYNWAFNGILIPPTYVEMEVKVDGVWINEGVMIDEEDVVHIASIEPEPPTPVEPVIQPLSVTENGTYTAPTGVDGYSPVSVNVSSGPAPVIEPITITENGIYTVSAGVDGYSPITVNVESGASFIPDDYSQYLYAIFDTEIVFNSSYRIEVAFYADSYVNDGHIVGQSYSSSGTAFHLTTYNNRWFIGGTNEASFGVDSDCPLYGEMIVYSAKTGSVSMNGVVKSTNFTMPTRTADTYKLNTRGGSISTTGKYKYKYVKIFDANETLLCNWEFGHVTLSAYPFYLAHDSVSGKYKLY